MKFINQGGEKNLKGRAFIHPLTDMPNGVFVCLHLHFCLALQTRTLKSQDRAELEIPAEDRQKTPITTSLHILQTGEVAK